MDTFIEYLNDIIQDKKIISLKNDKIIIEEKNKNAKLKEVKIEFNKNRFDILHISLDENNFEDKNSKTGIYSIFKREICSSADGILFVYDKKYKKFYVFHIELKSNTKNSENILKKQITSMEAVNFILSQIYLELTLGTKENQKNIKFPEKIYSMMIVYFKGNGIGNKNIISKRNYGIKKYSGKFSQKYYFYTQGILTENGKGIEKIKIDILCNLEEYLEQEIKLKEIILTNDKII
jgi:hypothetical protein